MKKAMKKPFGKDDMGSLSVHGLYSLRSGRCSELCSQSILYSYIGVMCGMDQLAPEFYSLVAKLKLNGTD